MSRLRVAVVSDALYPWHKGGKEVRYENLLRNLLDHDMDVTVYSMKWWREVPSPIITSRGTLRYRAICPRLTLYKGTRRSFFQAVIFAISTFGLLAFRFDVIEADHMPYLQLAPIRIVAWMKRVPLIVTWHEVWGKSGWRSYLGRLGLVPAFIERVSTKLPNEIVAVSLGTAERLVKIGADVRRITVIPNAIDFEQLLSISAEASAPELFFVGRLVAHKGASLVVEATNILVSRGYDIRLGIVGVGPEDFRLRMDVEKFGLTDRVVFYSSIDSQNDLWSLLRGCRVLLAPSVREGFGILVAESLAIGTPVVCAMHPENQSYHLISSGTGSVVPPFDAVALADAAEFWLNDVSDRESRANLFLDNHWSLSADRLAQSYAQLIKRVA